MEPDSQRSQTTILHLPGEILFRIMKLAGCCSTVNHDIRYVCKQFYKVYCANTSCGLTLASDKIRDDVIDSMVHSLRRTLRFDINDYRDASKLKKIVQHFAIHVRTLRFIRSDDKKDRQLGLVDIQFILSSMVNVKEVTIDEWFVHVEEPISINPIEMPSLKKLILVDCDAKSIDVLFSCVTSSLEEFYVQGDMVTDFTKFFKNNKAIKVISMAMCGKQANPEAFKHLQLSQLQIYLDGSWDGKDEFLRAVISHQPKLKLLNLLPDQGEVPYDFWFDEDDDDAKVTIDGELFAVICSFKDLESLKIAIGQVTPDVVGKISSLANLKELVVHAAGGGHDFDNEYDYDVNKMRNDVLYQNCFHKLIATSLPKLDSLTWSMKNCEWDDEYYMSEDEELMEHARQREYSGLDRIDVIATMAQSFPLLKCLRIEMETNNSSDINVRDALKLLPRLETLELNTDSTFKGDSPISIHENLKHLEMNTMETNLLIEMLGLMPNLESLVVRRALFSLEKVYLERLQAVIPHRLKKLELNFHSTKCQNFAIDNVVILQNIVKKLQTGKIKLTGNCDFDSLAEKIDRSVGVSLPRSPKWYIPGDDIGHESYMQLWK